MGRRELYDELIKPHLKKINEKIRQGITEEAIALELGISVPTLANYKKKYKELRDALSKAKGQDALNDLVNSGLESAKGHWVEETTTIYVPDEEGNPVIKQVTKNKRWVEPNPKLNTYYVNNFGKEKGFSNNPMENEMRKQDLDFKRKMEELKNGSWGDL